MKKEKVFLLGYMERFREPIRAGIKVLTIRVERKDGRLPEIGQILRKYTGMRTKGCKPIFDFKGGEIEPRCTGVWPIKIEIFRGMVILSSLFFVDVMKSEYSRLIHLELLKDKDFNRDDNAMADRFAQMDGWQSFSETIEFFRSRLPLDAYIIYWGKR